MDTSLKEYLTSQYDKPSPPNDGNPMQNGVLETHLNAINSWGNAYFDYKVITTWEWDDEVTVIRYMTEVYSTNREGVITQVFITDYDKSFDYDKPENYINKWFTHTLEDGKWYTARQVALLHHYKMVSWKYG